MWLSEAVYKVDYTAEEDRPDIDGTAEAERGVDWWNVNLACRREIPPEEYAPIHLRVPASDAAAWGMYGIGGTPGLISGAVVDLVGREAFRLYDLLPATINGTPYAFPVARERIDCLDLAGSEVEMYPHDPSRVMRIVRHRFHKERIDDHLVFSIPERLMTLYATESVRAAVAGRGIKGIRFVPVG